MDTNYIMAADQIATDTTVEAAVLELLSQWDDDYLCGCGLDDFTTAR